MVGKLRTAAEVAFASALGFLLPWTMTSVSYVSRSAHVPWLGFLCDVLGTVACPAVVLSGFLGGPMSFYANVVFFGVAWWIVRSRPRAALSRRAVIAAITAWCIFATPAAVVMTVLVTRQP